jgi:hypothetical protein
MLDELSDASPNIRKAASMVASELLENAIRYGESVPESEEIRFAFGKSAGVYRITVANGARPGDNVERLQERIRSVNEAEDRSALYISRLQELLDEPSEFSGLGIYRIGFEGGFDLECSYSANVVTVVATRRFA